MNGQELLDKALDLVREGNARKVTVRNGNGDTVAEIPLTFGVAGTLLAPTVAVLGAGAALVTGCSISLDKTEATAAPETAAEVDDDSGPEVAADAFDPEG